MADEIRNGGSKMRVVRLLGHRDDAGAWEIHDFLKRSVVESQWIELSTEEDRGPPLLRCRGRALSLYQARRHRRGRGCDSHRLCAPILGRNGMIRRANNHACGTARQCWTG